MPSTTFSPTPPTGAMAVMATTTITTTMMTTTTTTVQTGAVDWVQARTAAARKLLHVLVLATTVMTTVLSSPARGVDNVLLRGSQVHDSSPTWAGHSSPAVQMCLPARRLRSYRSTESSTLRAAATRAAAPTKERIVERKGFFSTSAYSKAARIRSSVRRILIRALATSTRARPPPRSTTITARSSIRVCPARSGRCSRRLSSP
mmetsp:Transcript_31331/g.67349  ORF Transcript_31331/g.67349 Transcript_31331/m.67349 type:complete len:204 (+) Transcript_31331:106-717(+)